MKKKWIVLLTSVILILSLGFIYFYNENQKKLEQEKLEQERLELERLEKIKQERISLIHNQLKFFEEGTSLENENDLILSFYNDILISGNDINNMISNPINISLSSLYKNELDSTKELVQNELNKIPQLLNIYEISLENKISDKEEYEKEIYLSYYEKNETIKNKEQNINKLNEYKSYLNEMILFIDFLKQNSGNYYIRNSQIIYKNESFKTNYEKYTKNLNLNFTIKDEITLGKKIPILMYHGVLDSPWGNSSLFVRVSEFENQMKYLKEQGYTPIYVSEINNAINYEKPIIITFDDGYLDVYTNAYPILKKYGFKANLYVITDWLGSEVYMSIDQMKELDSDNFEIGSHTLTHPALASLSTDEIERQVSESKQKLEEILEREITSIAYPTGSFDNRVINSSKKYYKYGLSTINDFEFSKSINTYSLRRIKIDRGISINRFSNLIK